MVKMKGWMSGLCLLLALVACDRAPAPLITHPVNDLAGVLSSTDEERLATRLVAHREATQVQVAVLTVRSLDGEPIEDFSHRVATRWGGGQRGRDNGVLVTLAIDDHRSRIEVGRGLEASLPDAATRTVLDNARPELRRGDYSGALHTILDGVLGRTGGLHMAAVADPAMAPTAPVVAPQAQSSHLGTLAWVVGLGLFTILSVSLFVYVTNKRERERLRAERAREDERREAEREQQRRTERMLDLERSMKASAAARAKLEAAKAPPTNSIADASSVGKVKFDVEKPASDKVKTGDAAQAKTFAAPVATVQSAKVSTAGVVAATAVTASAAYVAGSMIADQLRRSQEDSDRRDRERRDREHRDEEARERLRAERRRSESSSSWSSGSSYSSTSDSSSDSGSSSSSDWGGGGGSFDGGGSSSDW